MLSSFLEFLLAIKSLLSLKIFFFEFANIPGVPEGAKNSSRISTRNKKSQNIQNILFMNLQTLHDFQCL